MLTFQIIWRKEAGGDFYQQDWQGKTLAHAVKRWADFWGLNVADMAEFKLEKVTHV